jgi:hypothetical protein
MQNQNIHHKEIYEAIDFWANSNNLGQDKIITSLLEDFANEENLAIWATMNPFEFLPEPNNNKANIFEKLARHTSIARNIAVFIPVALTWKAVSEATSAFGEFVNQNSASTVNFLSFWQNGYEVLPDFWTISHVASLDFLIITLVIFLSIASTVFAQKSNSIKKIESEHQIQSRSEIALALKIYLHSLREIDRSNIKDSLASSVASLQTATRALTRTAGELDNVMSGMAEAIPNINDFGNKIHQETAKLNKQVSILTTNLAEINTSIVGELRDAVDSAATGLNIANSELDQSTNSIRQNALRAEREIKSFQGMIKKANKK